MEVYLNYERTIKNWSRRLSPWHSLVYCFAVCKRSAPLYYEFVERENWGDKEAISLSHELVELAVNGMRPDSEILEKCIERLETGTPDSEEFPDSAYGLDAGIIHFYSTELLRRHNPQNVYYVARHCYDIVDGQIHTILRPNGGVWTSHFEKEVERHEFLQNEIGWQSRVREELAQLEEGDTQSTEAKISEWIKSPLLR